MTWAQWVCLEALRAQPELRRPKSVDEITDNVKYWFSDLCCIEQEVNLAYENVKEVDVLDVTKEGADAWEAAIKR